MVTTCCAYNCNERASSGGSISFHRFPSKNEMRFRAWCIALRRKGFHPTWSSRVCSKHFTPDSFQSDCSFNRLLKSDAVPTIFDFSCKKKRAKKSLKTTKSYKRPKKTVDFQNNIIRDIGSEVVFSFEEKPNVVEIVKLTSSREKNKQENGMECCEGYQEQLVTAGDVEKDATDDAGDNPTVDKRLTIDSLPSDQFHNMQNENEILRQTIDHLSKKIERFKCLTNVLQSNELISEEAAEVLRSTIEM